MRPFGITRYNSHASPLMAAITSTVTTTASAVSMRNLHAL